MKIAVSANDRSIDSTINERFGRCPYLLIVDTDDMRVEVVENSNADLSTGAGIQTASLVVDKGAAAVLTGRCGPKAARVFDEAHIPVIQGQGGAVRDAVEKFKNGKLPTPKPGTAADAPGAAMSSSGSRFQSPGAGGGGRGMGGCGGRGIGGGRGMGRRCMAPSGPDPMAERAVGKDLSRQELLAQLQRQAEELRRQMDDIQSKIKTLV